MPFTPAATPGSDQINGANITGNDSVDALAGNDTVNADLNGGTATILLNFGNDVANVSGNGSLLIYGEENGDQINVNNAGSSTIYGGTGLFDPTDAADTINAAGAGSYLIYANGGDDFVTSTALGSVNIFSGSGADTVDVDVAGNFSTARAAGGMGADFIAIDTFNQQAVTVFGADAASDPADGNDTIFVGTGFGPAGAALVYGNGGNDFIAVGISSAPGSIADVFGGLGNDTIGVFGPAGPGADILVQGNQGADNIFVATDGVATIFGGGQAGDPTNDGADFITAQGQGSFVIYGNGGDDVIDVDLIVAGTATVFSGAGNDTVDIDVQQGNVVAYGGDNNDVISVTTDANATVFGGAGAFGPADGGDNIVIDDLAGGPNQSFVVYGNAGNDTIGTGPFDLDATTRVSVYGGAGADDFAFVGGDDVTYVYNVAGTSGFTAPNSGFDEIFNYTIFEDEIDLSGVTQASTTVRQVADIGTLAENVAAYSTGTGASTGSNTVVSVFQDGASLYVLVDNTLGSFNSSTDLLIEVNGAGLTTAALAGDLII